MHYMGQLPDLPLPGSGQRLRTRRLPLGQIVLCQGCCCGQTERGLPAVPLDYLKPIWKAEKLNKVVQLTVSGCLGPCDLPNVCCIVTPQEQTWYGRLTTTEDYAVLVDWARRCKERGELLPPPGELEHLRFQRWPSGDEAAFTPIGQDPADIILLTAADTEVLTWSAAAARLPAGFPSVRALNLDRLRDRRAFDEYLDDVLQESRVILLRVLGGSGYWREQLEQLHLLARAHRIHLLCLPGDGQPDPDLAAMCTVPLPVADAAWRYCIQGGVANAAALLRFLSDTFRGTAFGFDPPAALPEVGIYHPDHAPALSMEQWLGQADPRKPTAGLVFYRAHWVAGNLAPVDALVRALEARGMNVLPVFGPDLRTILNSGLLSCNSREDKPRTDREGEAPAEPVRELPMRGQAVLQDTVPPARREPRPPSFPVAQESARANLKLDVLITTTSFSASSLARSASDGSVSDPVFSACTLGNLDVPVLQAIFCSSSENVWAANIAGLQPRDIAMNVALPEFDGRIITTAVSFKNTLAHDPILQTEVVRYQPRADRVEQVANLAVRWARLRATPSADKRVAILLANYPSKNARVGNAVGLDTPASLHGLLIALKEAGYDTGPSLPRNGQTLIEDLIAASTQDEEFATEAALRQSPGWVTPDDLEKWLGDCAPAAQARIESTWGHLPRSSGFAIPGLLLGNIFVGIQPARGYDQDPSAVYHSPDLPPPPFYLAFYRWVRDVFAADAVIHLGKHGNLEWLPGKSAALSAACFPEVVLRDLPNIYPYIINNPGEGTQAKRRSAAVVVDHLIPPMTRAETHGELRKLEHLLDEFYTVQSLDPAKAPLLLDQIGRLVHETHLYRDLECDQPPSADDLPRFLSKVDGYLCEIKEAQIRDGLHVLGRLPEGDQLVDLLFSLVRQDNGSVPGLPKALAADLGLDYQALQADLAAPAPLSSFPGSAVTEVVEFRTCGDVVEALALLGRQLIKGRLTCLEENANSLGECVGNALRGVPELRTDMTPLQSSSERNATEGVPYIGPESFPSSSKTLSYLWQTIYPRLQLCHQEIDHVLAALAGRFVPPGPSGAPTRGTADILPTGRNFYSLDVRAVPTRTAWKVGSAAAEALVRRHCERTGNFPESVALVVWGTSNMRTGGDDIAQVLALLGVRPVWDESNRRVVGIEPVPLSELGRPRIDVTVRISGLFRDAFPNLVRLLNDAVRLVARLNEPLDRNFVKAHLARDVARLVRGQVLRTGREGEAPAEPGQAQDQSAIPLEEAERIAGLRVFGSKPGAYGAGLLPAIDARNWDTADDLADIYLTWSSWAYNGDEADGREERTAFRLRLAQTDVVAQNQDNREHDIFDSDDYFQFHGGMIAAVRALAGAPPAAYLGDTSQPDDVKVRTLKEEAFRVFRARVVNPKWLAGVMRHGYKGAVEMAATVDYLFGYDATAEVVEDWMYQRLAEAYLFDARVQDFLRQSNPWAERAMIERLLEAAERGLWEQPGPETLERLRQQHGGNDAWLEGVRVERPR